MKLGSRRLILAAAGMTVVWLIGVVLAESGSKISTRSSIASLSHSNHKMGRGAGVPICGSDGFALAAGQAAPDGQVASQQRPQMSEEVFKNVTALKGIPVDEFMATMGLFSAALSMCCSECHTGAGTDKVDWVVDTPRKVTGRRMVAMVAAINRDNFSGRQVVTCWTCHRGRDFPVVTPSLDLIYGSPVLDLDDVLPRPLDRPASAPTADQILDKYVQALGGAARLASLTSFVAKGAAVGFGGFRAGDVEIFAKAPDQRATFIHTLDAGDLTRKFDGRAGSISTPLTTLKAFPLNGNELEGARLDARMSFPGQVKQFLTNWRVGSSTTINSRPVEVVQGTGVTGVRGLFATLYFDQESGLLVRLVRYTNSAVGRVPVQVDYADYREVAGVKIPFRWTYAWLDGRDEYVLSEVQPNVPIDAAKFATAERVLQ